MERGISSFNGDLFPPSSPERKRRKLDESNEINSESNKKQKKETTSRKTPIIHNYKVYNAHQEFVNVRSKTKK